MGEILYRVGNRVVAEDSAAITPAAAGDYGVTISVDSIENIDHLIHLDVDTEPDQRVHREHDTKISGNNLGTTLGVAAGTTLTAKAIVVSK